MSLNNVPDLYKASLLEMPNLESRVNYFLDHGELLMEYYCGSTAKRDLLNRFKYQLDPCSVERSGTLDPAPQTCPDCGTECIADEDDSTFVCHACGTEIFDLGSHQSYRDYMEQSSTPRAQPTLETKRIKQVELILDQWMASYPEQLDRERYLMIVEAFQRLNSRFNNQGNFPPYKWFLFQIVKGFEFKDLALVLSQSLGRAGETKKNRKLFEELAGQ
jgi:hypothetical protein